MNCKVYLEHQVLNVDSQNCFVLKADGTEYYTVHFPSGSYRLELWGASGGASLSGRTNIGGCGGYTTGIIDFASEKTLYFYLGTAGENSSGKIPGAGGYNGGASGATDDYNDDCCSGGSGGASDIRYTPGVFSLSSSLNSRIMVAGGGGSGGCWITSGRGGNSGGLKGSDGESNYANNRAGGAGGTQSTGYSLGIGEVGEDDNECPGSGGGGYWGGIAGEGGYGGDIGAGGGGGGSSYISGYPGCKTISSYVFSYANMTSIDNPLPTSDLSSIYESTGHYGNGFARIVPCSKTISLSFCPNIITFSKLDLNHHIPIITLFVLFL